MTVIDSPVSTKPFEKGTEISLTLESWNLVALRYNSNYHGALRVLYDFGVLKNPSVFDPYEVYSWVTTQLPNNAWTINGSFLFDAGYLHYLRYELSPVLSQEDQEILKALHLAVKYSERLQELRTFVKIWGGEIPAGFVPDFHTQGIYIKSSYKGTKRVKVIFDLIAAELGCGHAHVNEFNEELYLGALKAVQSGVQELDPSGSGYFTSSLTVGEEIKTISGWARSDVTLSGPYGPELSRLLRGTSDLTWQSYAHSKAGLVYLHAYEAHQDAVFMYVDGFVYFDDRPFSMALPSYSINHSDFKTPFEFGEELVGWVGELSEQPQGILHLNGKRYDSIFVDPNSAVYSPAFDDSYYDYNLSGYSGDASNPLGVAIDSMNHPAAGNMLTVDDIMYELPATYRSSYLEALVQGIVGG